MHKLPIGDGESVKRRITWAYLFMIGGGIIGFLAIRALGETLSAQPLATAAFGPRKMSQDLDIFLRILLALVVVIVTARLLGAGCKYLQQPPVMGEVLAGIILGPSLLGHIAPAVWKYLMPPLVAPYFGVLAQVGVILYMFLVGLEVDPHALRRGAQATVFISHASIIVPFLLGGALSLLIYPTLSMGDVPFTVFALFMGISMSVTAFPVLARILSDRRMQKTDLGVMALSCAAVGDVTAWCMLAFVVSVVQARMDGAVYTIALTVAYIAFVLLIARPVIARWARDVNRHGELNQSVMAVVVIILLVSALTTESIGVHAVFGAFLVGLVIPSDTAIARELTHRLHDVVAVLLLPAFFAFTGMRTEIGLVTGVGQWLMCGAIILVACLGKFCGTAVPARLTGMAWREASALGILMNTRGLMELIVLSIGLDLGVLSPTLFTMLVLMAIVTTFMTTPILQLCTRRQTTTEVMTATVVPSELIHSATRFAPEPVVVERRPG